MFETSTKTLPQQKHQHQHQHQNQQQQQQESLKKSRPQHHNSNSKMTTPNTKPSRTITPETHKLPKQSPQSTPQPQPQSQPPQSSSTPSPSPLQTDKNTNNNNNNTTTTTPPEEKEDAVVTPELLVDALSGHEDGLLAIAERLMEHYEGGYDVMGEAIIDAFADVQKLFQHVVEAAHMEGAAFESSRREAELAAAAKASGGATTTPGRNTSLEMEGGGVGGGGGGVTGDGISPMVVDPMGGVSGPGGGGGLTRHEEFIDQDVRDIISNAIQQGQSKRDSGQHMECYELYEEACHSASALLPVDSDHRGRLQLSVARAESMSPERACAILRYAMDDVLRSGQNILRQRKNPDPSQRGDCVLKPPAGPRSPMVEAGASNVAMQSHEEALASLVEEMKEVLSAPVYENTPVQEVAMRFWVALEEAQKNGKKKEEQLEKELGQLKGEFLLARAEWEEKLSNQTTQAESFKKKYYTLKEQVQQFQYMDHARSSAHRIAEHSSHSNANNNSNNTSETSNNSKPFGAIQSVFSGGDASDGLCTTSVNRCSPKSNKKNKHRADRSMDLGQNNSVASFGSVLGQHARSLVGSFGCTGSGSSIIEGDVNHSMNGSSPNNNNHNNNRLSPPPSVVSATDSQNGSTSRYSNSHYSSTRRSSSGKYNLPYMGSRDI